MYIPEVSVSLNGSAHTMSTLSRELILKRTVYLTGEVTEGLALSVITQLRYLDDSSDEPVVLVINRPGGSVADGLAIYDTMQFLHCPVATVSLGLAASMGRCCWRPGPKGCVTHRPAAAL